MRRLVALLLICLMPLPVQAQGPAAPKLVRVRVTGPATYEVPGVWRFEGDHVVGKAVTSDTRFVQFTREDDGRVLTILRPGRRLTGIARGIAGDLLEFVSEGNAERIHIPLDALTKIEVSRERRPLGKSLAAGVFTGLGIFLASWRGLAESCDEGRCGSPSVLLGIVAGAAIATGTLVARKLHGQRWEIVSADELGALLNAPPNPI